MLPTHVLIIDDSKLITKLISKALLTNKIPNHHFEEKHIHVAHDGMQAFEMLGKNPDISLVISDVNMPILNGEELIEILIDVDKITKLDLFFVTTQNIASSMTHTSLEYSVGVITKPFNETTFSEQFNSLQLSYQNKVEEQRKIKAIHERQKRHLSIWLHDYIKQKELPLSEKVLDHLIEVEFKHYNKIEDSELFMMFSYILEYYFSELKIDATVDLTLIEDIKDTWFHPDEYAELGLEENYKNILSNAKEMLQESSTGEDFSHIFLQPITTMLKKIKQNKSSTAKLSYNDFYPYFQDLVNIFATIDPMCQVKKINTRIKHIQEMKKLYEEMRAFLNNSQVTSLFPFLEKDGELAQMIEEKFKLFSKHIEREIIPSYVYDINNSLWHQAKRSPKIANFLQSNIKNKMPNTHNLLYHFKKISKEDMKQYLKYEKIKTSVISNDRETLLLFKENLIQHLPHWEVSVYTNGNILHNNIEKHKYEKLIVDLNFKDAVFNNGLQFIKHLQKNAPHVKEILNNNNLYFLASSQQVEILHNKHGGLNYNIILKPLTKTNIYQKVFWES